jgi:hypothetical protein
VKIYRKDDKLCIDKVNIDGINYDFAYFLPSGGFKYKQSGGSIYANWRNPNLDDEKIKDILHRFITSMICN